MFWVVVCLSDKNAHSNLKLALNIKEKRVDNTGPTLDFLSIWETSCAGILYYDLTTLPNICWHYKQTGTWK